MQFNFSSPSKFISGLIDNSLKSVKFMFDMIPILRVALNYFIVLTFASVAIRVLSIVAYVATIKALIWLFNSKSLEYQEGFSTTASGSFDFSFGTSHWLIFLASIFSLVFFCRRLQAYTIKKCSKTALITLFNTNLKHNFSYEFLTIKLPIFFSQFSIAISTVIFISIFISIILSISFIFGLFIILGCLLSMLYFVNGRRINTERQLEMERYSSKLADLKAKRKSGKQDPTDDNKATGYFFRLLDFRLSKWQEDYEIVHIESFAIGFFIILLITASSLITLPDVSNWQLIFLAVGTKFVLGAGREFSQSIASMLNGREDVIKLSQALNDFK